MLRWEDDGMELLGWFAVAALVLVLASVAALIGIAWWALT